MPENVSKFQTFDGVEHDIEDTAARTALDNVYTKTETDTLLAGKVDNDEIYDKHTLNQILDSKADEADVYSKTDADALLALKANAADVYTKTEDDALLALKADAADVYTKTEADTLLSAKADVTTVDAALALKANAADVYTITQSDALLDAKAGIDDSSTTATVATWSASKMNIEFQEKVSKFTDAGYVGVDALAYDSTNERLGLKIGGADTVIPFSKPTLHNIGSIDNTSGNGGVVTKTFDCTSLPHYDLMTSADFIATITFTNGSIDNIASQSGASGGNQNNNYYSAPAVVIDSYDESTGLLSIKVSSATFHASNGAYYWCYPKFNIYALY